MILDLFKYVDPYEVSGCLENDVGSLLDNNGKHKTFLHVSNVAETCASLAEMFGLNAEKCRISGYLHDISAVIAPSDMLQYAQANKMPICEAELKYPFLLHQRMSRIVAKEHFGISDETGLLPLNG